MNNLQELIEYHLNKYQGMQARDVYKLLFQGVFGPEHLLSNPAAAKDYLLKEWESIKAHDAEELLEPVSIDGNIVRVNLRSYKAKQHDLNILWNAFLNSASMKKTEKSQFILMWNEFVQLCSNNMFNFNNPDVSEFSKEMEEKDYPAAHHSQSYRENNWPAYRVVLKSEIYPYI